ncbi:hypothetical protein GPJ56_008110 [Histomonas meleagridis]|uniref:uncharacterized protein n=1 Tax=Histomonas meleagridis TaxID=135588 RepID=UPI003559B058|nr:hypothetical protein GPJ56_008110 [Histomonas meleagridis]KAH0798939.1 hypothetical protein GO595_008229 [Histomonas meleagridis]
MSSLKNTISRLLIFSESHPLRVIYNENGKPITSINEVIPGSTIYASSQDPKDDFVSITQKDLSSSNTETDDEDDLHQQPQHEEESENDHQDQPIPEEKKSTQPSQKTSRNESIQSFISEGNELQIIKNPIQDQENETQSHETGSSHDEVEDQKNEAEENYKLEQQKIHIENIQNLVKNLPEPMRTSESIHKAIGENFSPLVTEFEYSYQSLQTQQEAKLLSSKHILNTKIPPHSDELDQKAIDIIKSSTFTTSFGCYSSPRIAIVGPPESGKSVFHQLLCNKMVSYLISTGQYKTTFIMRFDISELIDVIQQPILLYKRFVRMIFERITSQRIIFKPFCETLIQYFQQLPTVQHFPILQKNFSLSEDFRKTSQQLKTVSENLYNCIKQHFPLSIWLTNVLMLPKLISNSFGFERVLFLIDHFDLSDVDIPPQEPFIGNSSAYVTLSDHMKFMLNSESFIIACKNEDKLFDVIEASTFDDIDLFEGTEFVSVVDTELNGHSDEFEFDIFVDENDEPLRLKLSDCGGCPAYLRKWDEIIKIANEIVWNSKNKEEKLRLLTCIREMAPMLIVRVDPRNLTLEKIGNMINDVKIIKN